MRKVFCGIYDQLVRADRSVYDDEKHRWYIKLTTPEAREIRAKFWQNELMTL